MKKRFIVSRPVHALMGLVVLALAGPLAGRTSGQTRAALWVSPMGNDSTGARGRFELPFQHAWDVRTNSTGFATGACTAARPGDVIVFMPGVHRVAAVPLPDNVDLWAMPGAVLVRGDFTNGTLFGTPLPMPANLNTCGPMIVPGHNSRIDLRAATCIATNAVYDAVIGWFELLDTRRVFNNFGFDNRPKTNVLILAGDMIGTSDVVYFTQTNSQPASVTFEGGDLRSGWDCFRLHGNIQLWSRGVKAFSTNTVSPGFSQGMAISGGAHWQDFHSHIGSGGGTNRNTAVRADGASMALNLTTLYTTGHGGLPLFLASGATATGCAIYNGMPFWLASGPPGSRGPRYWLGNQAGLQFILRTESGTNVSLTPVH